MSYACSILIRRLDTKQMLLDTFQFRQPVFRFTHNISHLTFIFHHFNIKPEYQPCQYKLHLFQLSLYIIIDITVLQYPAICMESLQVCIKLLSIHTYSSQSFLLFFKSYELIKRFTVLILFSPSLQSILFNIIL